MTATASPAARTARHYLADQYEREGMGDTARRIRNGEITSLAALRALRAIEAAQRDAVAARVRR